MSKLIAMVATAVMLGGVRTIIQPGETLPDLSAHDERELLQSGAAQNPADEAALAKAQARAEAVARAEFEDARQAVQAAQVSGDAGAGDAEAPAKAAHKPAAKR